MRKLTSLAAILSLLLARTPLARSDEQQRSQRPHARHAATMRRHSGLALLLGAFAAIGSIALIPLLPKLPPSRN